MNQSTDRKHSLRTLLLAAFALGTVAMPVAAQTNDKTLFFISNTHLDTQWNWDVKTTIGSYLKNTLDQNLALLDKYPHFQINFEGAIRYMWMKEYYPSQYARMKDYIKSNRWHVSGMSVDANDVMVSSAESILHSMLYANKFYKQEFGVRGGYDIMLPDCFGFSYALPSLARHAGIKGFHTAKLGWGSAAYDQLPPFGIWQGVDGSQIYAVYKPGAYDTHEEFNKDMTMDASMVSKIEDNISKYGVPAMLRYVGPRSDHGGGLRDEAGSTGENTPYWLNLSAEKTDGSIKVKLATPDEFFDYLASQDQSRLLVWNSELPMRVHGVGAYTSRGELKMWNRRNELLGDAAEKASSLAYWLVGSGYPAEIRDAWIRMLWQQHHDGITGTSIPKAYEYSHNEYFLANRQFGMALTNAIGSIAQNVNTNVDGIPVMVFNPLSHDRTDIVEGSMPCASQPQGIRVYDRDGREVLSQMTGYDDSSKTLKFIFAAKVPSLGYSIYNVKVGEASALTADLSIDGATRTLSNANYRLKLSLTGDPSIYNIKSSSYIMGSSRMQMMPDYEQVWPAWEISYNTVKQTSITNVNENVQISIAEDGPLRKSFRVERTKNGSTFVQYYRMSALTDRIDCVNEVDWQSRNTLLKVNFPFYFANDETTYDISLGTIKRGIRNSDCYEMQGHQWADHSKTDGSFGVSIINDSKYGWDKPSSSSLRLTLIHTPECGNYKHQAEQDLGPNHFTYAFYPHEGTWSQATQMEAAHVNQPLIAFVTPKHDGALPTEMSFVRLSSDKVSVKAVKKAEETDEVIVRVYEWTGEDHNGLQMTFPADIISAREVNALEEYTADVSYSDNTLTFDIGHYQPKTFAVKLAKPSLTAVETASTPVPLTYNADAMSNDDAKGNALSALRYAYPAELLKGSMTVDGVPFSMGSSADGALNIIRCSTPQTITLDRKTGQDKLYLLMASYDADGSKATITVGDTRTDINVPYFSGYAGQPMTAFNLGQQYRMDNIAYIASHAHNISERSNDVARNLYIYKYCVQLPEGVGEVSISCDDRALMIFAATLSDNKADDIRELTKVNTLIEYNELGDASDCGERLTPDRIAYSHQNGINEGAAKANDGDITTKWCVLSTQSPTPYLEYQFNNAVEVCSYTLFSAGIEDMNYITRDFRVQRYDDATAKWEDVDVVTQNVENRLQRSFIPFKTTRLRLQIDQGEYSGTTTRVFEFAVYGKDTSLTSVRNVNGAADAEPACYGIDGIRLSQPRKGVNIRHDSDGSVRKILVK